MAAPLNLDYVKRAVAAGKMPEDAWEFFRHVHFRDLSEADAQRELETWAAENDIEMTLFDRDVNDGKVTYVMFSER